LTGPRCGAATLLDFGIAKLPGRTALTRMGLEYGKQRHQEA
jgi:hypothetical protein